MKINIIFLPILFLILFPGCSDDSADSLHGKDAGRLRFDYMVDGEVKETRSVAAVQDEIRLESALIFFYDLDSRKALAYTYVRPEADSRTISFDPPETLNADTDYNTLILGNPDNYIGDKTPEKFADDIMGLDYEAARVEISYLRSAPITRGNPGVLPMYGQFVDAANKNPKTFRYHKYSDVITADGLFFFSRAVSRIDLENFVPSTLLIEEVKLINYQSTGYPLTEGLRGNAIIDYLHSGPEGWMSVEANEAGENSQKLSSVLYCFPNIVTSSQPNDNVTTALLIKGRYCESKDGENYDEESTYYRFNLTTTGKGQVLSRNYAYRATIKGVKRRGAATPGEAVNESTPVFDYAISDEWQAADDNAVSDGRGNYLIVSKSFVTFEGENDEGSSVVLNVVTSPGLEWSIAPYDDSESADTFSNELFTCEKEGDSMLRIAPKQANNTTYVRYGRYLITGHSSLDPSVKLNITINIQHLTTQFNYSMLTVDGCVGSISKRLNPSGGVLRLKVMTGSSSNAWYVTDMNNAILNWGANSYFTTMGNNGAELEITYDPNVSGASRETVLKVYLDPAINSDEVVKPVFVTLTQDMTTELFSLSPSPVDGCYDFDCCSYDNMPTLTPRTNGNIYAKTFALTVIPAAGVNMEIKTNFIARDIQIDTKNWTTPASMTNRIAPATDLASYAVLENNLTSTKPYYISVEAMAPGDGTQTCYKMHFKATDPVSGYVQERLVTFRMHAIEGDINDCIIRVRNNEDTDFDYYLIPDRNLGVPGRVGLNDDEQQAYYFMTSGDGLGMIPEFQSSQPFSTYSQFSGTIYQYTQIAGSIESWIRDQNSDSKKLYSPFYLPEDLDKWEPISSELLKEVYSRIIFSKCRGYVLSDYPRISREGKKIPVFRWLNIWNKSWGISGNYLSPENEGFTISARGWITKGNNLQEGVSFPCRKLSKEEVADYLINYLGYSQSSLPAELRLDSRH